MGKIIELTSADGHKFAAYRADHAGKPRGSVEKSLRGDAQPRGDGPARPGPAWSGPWGEPGWRAARPGSPWSGRYVPSWSARRRLPDCRAGSERERRRRLCPGRSAHAHC